MYKLFIISDGISIIVEEVSPTYFSLEMRTPLEFSLGFVAIEVSLWRCSELLPEASPVFDRTEAIHGRSLPHSLASRGLSGNASSRKISLGFVAIEISLWYCSDLLPEVSPVFDRAEAILGEIPPTYARSLWKCVPPREFSLGFVAIEVSLWRCSKLLPEVSPVFERTKAVLGEISPTYASLPKVSWKCAPLVSSLSGSLPSRSLFGAVAIYYRRSLQYSFVQKLFLGRSAPHTLAFQRSLWKYVPSVSFLLGSLPSRSLFGTVKNDYKRSLQYSILQNLLLGRSLLLTLAFQRSL